MGLSVEQANQLLTNYGYFQGLNRIFNQYGSVPHEKGAVAKAHAFNLLLQKVVEAKVRIAKLQVSVNRLEAACRAGVAPKPSEGLDFDSVEVKDLLTELLAFDGIAAEIFESSASLLSAAINPETTADKARGLRVSHSDLWSRQKTESFQLLNRNPQVFEMIDFPKPVASDEAKAKITPE